jgi:hypothetical protein
MMKVNKTTDLVHQNYMVDKIIIASNINIWIASSHLRNIITDFNLHILYDLSIQINSTKIVSK